MEPFPAFLLESRVIIDKRCDLCFIDGTCNSRLEKKSGKRLYHALEDVVGLKQGAFIDLLALHVELSCARKLLKALLEITCKPSILRLQISTRVACYARTHVMMLHSSTVWLSPSDVIGKNLCSLIFISNRYPPP